MPDPVVTPAPSTVTPAAAPVVAPVVAPAVAAVAPVVAAAPADPNAPAPAVAPVTPATAPESYDFSKVELPQGVTLNADLVAAMSPVLKELGLSQDAANKLVKTHAEALAKAEVAGETQREADFKVWMKDNVAKNLATLDKLWGAEKDAKLAIAMGALAKHGTPALKAKLDDTGLGTDPDFVQFFHSAGLMSREDTPPNVVQPTSVGKSTADALYGNSTPANH